MNNCLFCKIMNGEIPSKKIYEDDKVYAFLDINPNSNGHVLLIPKKHYVTVLDIDKDFIGYALEVIQEKLYPLLKTKLGIDGLTISQNNFLGQDVKHYHIHLIPRYDKNNPLKEKIDVEKIYQKLTSNN